jgi:hypothetical protein
MTPGETKALIGILATSFPGSRMTSGTIDVYKQMLSDLDRDVASAAVKQLIRTARFLPTIAEIRAACVAIEDGPAPSALEQWGIVGNACATVGCYSPQPAFKDAVTERCVRAMGWRYLCKSPNEAADRARFCEMYRELDAHRQTARQTGELPPALEEQAPPWKALPPAATDEQDAELGRAPAPPRLRPPPVSRGPATEAELEARRIDSQRRLAEWARENEQKDGTA